MPEQLGFKQFFGDRSTVNYDKRLVPARAVKVDRLGEKLLPRSGFAANQDGCIGRSSLRGVVENPHESAGMPQNVLESELAVDIAPQCANFLKQAASLHRAINQSPQLIRVKGFGEIVVRAGLHGLNSVGYATEGGH